MRLALISSSRANLTVYFTELVSVASCCWPGLSFGPGQRAGARKCPKSTLLQRNQWQREGNMDINLLALQVRPARWHIALTIPIGTEASIERE
jgi:hypothetical protein